MVGGARPRSLRAAQSCPTAAAPPYAGPAALLPCRTWGRESRLRQSPRQRCWYTVSQEHRRVRSRARRAARALAEVAAVKLVESCSSPCTLLPPMLLSPPPAPRMGESMILGVLWGGIRLVGIDVGLGFRSTIGRSSYFVARTVESNSIHFQSNSIPILNIQY